MQGFVKGEYVLYDHHSRRRLWQDEYSAPAIVLNVGKTRVTIRGLVDGKVRSVAPYNLRHGRDIGQRRSVAIRHSQACSAKRSTR